MPRTYKNRKGVERIAPYWEDLDGFDPEDAGWCLACGALSEIEPDARKVQCEECMEHAVYGWGELVLMGLVSHDPDIAD